MGDELTARDPRQLGRWVLQSRLGFGGMGVVYLGTSGDQRAAVKVVRPGLLDESHVVERFAREVAVLQTVRDVHISQFMGADLHGEPAWLAIEYIPGPTLKQQVTEHGPLGKEQWWELARAMAQALAVLDVHRVVHRDLKPGNVILSNHRPVLIDFGIAHPEDATSLTATGLVTGSPSWLSPEQANSATIGAASDIFSLGSLLAYAGTGRPPFGDGVAVAVLVRISSEEPDTEGLDEDQAALVRDLLAKDPAERPTARELLDRLRLNYYDLLQPTVHEPARKGRMSARAVPAKGSVAPAGQPPQPSQPLDDVTTPQGVPALEQTSRTAQMPALTPEQVSGRDGGAAADVAADAVTRVLPLRQEPAADAPAVQPPVASPSQSVPSQSGPSQPGRDRGRIPKLVGGGLIAAVLAWGGFTLLAPSDTPGGGGDSTPTATASPDASEDVTSPAPSPTGDAPGAPSSDVLRSGDWLLASYQLNNDGETMSVTGTVRNTGDSAGSADLVVWVFAGGESLGAVTGSVSDVPAGGDASVTLNGNFAWQPGGKTLVVEATPR